MRISFKILIVIWVVLFLGFGAVIYTTYSRLQPETFIGLLREQVEKNYPGSSLTIGEMDYRPAFDLSLKFKNIQIFRPERKLGSIAELEVRLPWWLLISDRGNAQINLTRLEIYVSRDSEEKKTKEMSQGSKTPRLKVSLPSFLAGAKFTLRAKDTVIRDVRDGRRIFVLSKLLVKEFHYGKNSAFELNLPIEISHNRAKFTSELWLFGDVTPDKDLWHLNFRGEFKTRDLTDKSDLEDLAIDGKADFRPSEMNLISSVFFLIDRNKVGEGKITADKAELGMNFTFSAFPLEYLGIFSEELKNPYLPALSGPSEGVVRIRRNLREHEGLKLESKFVFDGIFPIDADHTFAGKWQFSFSHSRWETSFITPRSEVSFFRRSIIDVPKGEVVQYMEEIGFSGVELDPVLSIQMTLQQFRAIDFPHYYSTKVSLKDCTQGEAKVSGTLFHGFTPHQRFYQLSLAGAGSLRFDYQARDRQENLSLEASDFLWSKGMKFFDPIFTAESALVTGKFDGKWSQDWSGGTFQSALKLQGLKGAQGGLLQLLSRFWSEFSLDPLVSEDQTWQGNFARGVMNLTDVTLGGPDMARLTGTVAPPKKSFLILTYPKNKKWKPVRKELSQFNW